MELLQTPHGRLTVFQRGCRPNQWNYFFCWTEDLVACLLIEENQLG